MSSRYKSQIFVSEIGQEGQKLIDKAKILIIGAGGLGIPLATYLASSGVGNITIVDGDVISIGNLHRQYLYTENEIGKNKATILKEKLGVINPEIKVDSIPHFFDQNLGDELVSNADIICDCTDNVDARILIDSMCAKFQKPLVYAAVKDWIGYLSILNYKSKTRLTDIFSLIDLQAYSKDNCSVTGIVGTTCGILGSMQASEVLKIILGQELFLDGRILCHDALNNTQRTFKIKPEAAF